MKYLVLIFIPLMFASCSVFQKEDKSEIAKREIVQTEKDFASFCKSNGIQEAFTQYAADSAVILLSDSLIIGKENVQKHYAEDKFKDAQLIWEPDFVDASKSGDMGYTYGRYVYKTKDIKGNPLEFKGYFHTVWKRQTDGTWRFVWD